MKSFVTNGIFVKSEEGDLTTFRFKRNDMIHDQRFSEDYVQFLKLSTSSDVHEYWVERI